jgi:hypothetical protein
MNLPAKLRTVAVWVVQKIGENLIGAIIGFIGVATIIATIVAGVNRTLKATRAEWQCVTADTCKINGWSLGALILVTAALLAAAVYLAFRLSKAPRPVHNFTPISVDDEYLHLRWIIRVPPSEWIDEQLDGLPAANVSDILDGPFHLALGCHERLSEYYRPAAGYGVSPGLHEYCPGCEARVLSPADERLDSQTVLAWDMRAQTLAELQRMHRVGLPIKGPRIVLGHPRYWKKVAPP